ncbi:tail fiber domain-containing protein, partial [bacterium]
MLVMLQVIVFAGNKKISYQGKLNDGSGNPIDTAGSPITVTFRLYDALTGGNEVWAQNQGVEFEDGFFNVTFEDDGLDNLAFHKQYYISIQVSGDDEMSPRQPISASGYALGSLGNFDVGGNLYIDGMTGVGTQTPEATLDVSGSLQTQLFKVKTDDDGGGDQFFSISSYWDGVIRMNPGKRSTIFMNREVGSHKNFHLLDGYTYPVLTTIGASGNVGIGTWGPQKTLEIHGNSTGEVGIRIDNDGATSSASGSYWDIYEKGGANGSLNIKHGGSNYQFQGFFIRRKDNQPIFGIQDSSAKPYSLWIGDNGNIGVGKSNPQTNLDVAGNVNVSGKIGVGTLSPNEALHVNGRLAVGEGAGYAAAVGMAPTIMTKGAESGLRLESTAYGVSGGMAAGYLGYSVNGSNGVLVVGTNGTNGLCLFTNTQPRMTIKGDDGYVGVNTLNPSYHFQVHGFAAAWSHSATSDIRLKKNVKELKGRKEMMKKLKRLKSLKYELDTDKIIELEEEKEETAEMLGEEKAVVNKAIKEKRQKRRAALRASMKELEGKNYIGLSAQEVEKEFPEIVITGKDGYKSIAYGRLS